MDKQQKIASVLKWVGTLLTFAVLAPIIFSALEGLVAFIAFVVVGSTAAALAPWFSMMLTTLAIKLFKIQVEMNPIEAMQRLKMDAEQDAEDKRNAIVNFEGTLNGFKQKLVKIKRDYPDEAAQYDQMVRDEETALVEMKQEYTELCDGIRDLDKEITKNQALYELAKDALKVAELDGDQKKKFYSQLAHDTAVNAVQAKVNRSMAALNSSVMKRQGRSLALPEPKASAQQEVYRGVKQGEVVR